MQPTTRRILNSIAALFAAAFLATSGAGAQDPSWFNPFPAFRIADNIYYVGTEGLANYLITTPQGHILINSDFEVSVPRIRASVESLDFKFGDIKILLISHAHNDHVAGSAMIKKMTGADYMVMDADIPVVESGGASDFAYGADLAMHFPITKVDRVLHDGDTVRLGDAVLVAHRTPGHTKGNTTWTMQAMDHGTRRSVLILGGLNVSDGYRLVGNAQYPTIADDYARSFDVLRTLPCEIFLGAHGSYFELSAKYARLKNGDQSAFVDSAGCRAFLSEREEAFRTELAKQRAAAHGRLP